ncbi:uncharacterized protein DNG_09172 [Cephalotrichum gorgonifer]|uniref:Xylanolytic transcriptional activator regulatory domain-containing protein n=1 Tax=Cephalotrichum gorgonifer TaxID=2041049 RepID=A0AAE8SZW9_9PEZI|nr:uncharacterized protein DNG_09172 [Cephalotrichum gorgonifer]
MAIQDHSSTRTSNEFYGESSLVSLLREMVQPPSKNDDQGGRSRRTTSPPPATPTAGYSTGYNASSVSAMLQEEFALPPREVTDRLLGTYFDSVHIFYPWTHSLSFQDEYERLWSPPRQDDNRPDIGLGGGRCPRRVFFTALNAMLALGCEFSNVCPEDKEAASAMFFNRMKKLLQFDILDSGSISHVQALLLVGQYLLCTHYPTQCWNVVGLAGRMAIGLGLQLNRCTDDVSEIEKEIKRRVWYGCVQMDMTVSMTLGRPPSLYLDENVPLPLPIDDVYMPLNAPHIGQPPGTYSTNMFTVENIKLANLLGKILESVYQRSITAGTAASSLQGSVLTHDDLNVILHIDSQLESFADSLPPGLQWDMAAQSNDEIPPTLKRQSNVLRARFLHMKVFLYRPSFTSFCASAHSRVRARGQRNPGDQKKERPKESEVAMALRTQCALVCVRKTCELVQSLRNATTEDATGAWWFTVFYLITSAIIIILTECTPSLKYHLDEHVLAASWEKCVETLRLVAAVNPVYPLQPLQSSEVNLMQQWEQHNVPISMKSGTKTREIVFIT